MRRTQTPRDNRASRLGSLLLLFVATTLAACHQYTDKRLLQYLNTEGFGNRYTGNAEEDNYVRIGDTLGVTDSYHPEELSIQAKVDIDGTVLLPELGAVHVAGMTRTEIEAFLMEKYHNYYDLVDIKVAISTEGKVYYVFGEVELEGARPFPGDYTLFEAVMDAVPIRSTANLGRVRLIRADPRDPFRETFDITDMIDKGDSTYNVLLRENDIVYVPPTFIAQIGYFIEALLFPVRVVVQSLFSAFVTVSGVGNFQRTAATVF